MSCHLIYWIIASQIPWEPLHSEISGQKSETPGGKWGDMVRWSEAFEALVRGSLHWRNTAVFIDSHMLT